MKDSNRKIGSISGLFGGLARGGTSYQKLGGRRKMGGRAAGGKDFPIKICFQDRSLMGMEGGE